MGPERNVRNQSQDAQYDPNGYGNFRRPPCSPNYDAPNDRGSAGDYCEKGDVTGVNAFFGAEKENKTPSASTVATIRTQCQ